MRANVLVVGDQGAATQLTSVLATDYQVRTAHDAESAMTDLRASRPALVIAAGDLPDLDRIELCRRIRLASTTPVIVLSWGADARSEVAALDAGADDHISGPFGGSQLLARVRAVLRGGATSPEASVLNVGDFSVAFDDRRVRLHGQAVRLTPKEFDLFVVMARRPNQLLSHRALLEAVWGPDLGEHVEYVRVFIGQLRRKLETNPSDPRYIVTQPWVGYRFHPAGSREQQLSYVR
ncbi:MAG TPA: response regulator transcription factor, partial [Vicinamibacterales bacterium]|nr:response regulator transcription factor [Vicinamibacterales bacterium]